jgi:membrane-bound ClpP family serine protease
MIGSVAAAAISCLVMLPELILLHFSVIGLAGLLLSAAVMLGSVSAYFLLLACFFLRYSLRSMLAFMLALGSFTALLFQRDLFWQVLGVVGLVGIFTTLIEAVFSSDPEDRKGL